MDISEINEISDAFTEAWEEYFGAPMFLIPFDENTHPNIYMESKHKKYKHSSKKLFHGTLKEIEAEDEDKPTGRRTNKIYIITFTTKELASQGVTKIDTRDIIEFTDAYGNKSTYRIFDEFQKVQLNAFKIFTKLKVILNE